MSEKNILPSAEDLKAEKVHEGVLKGVEGFTPDKLKQTKTREAASPLDVAKSELAHQKTAEQLKDFDKNKLKHAETQEKNPLPDNDSKLHHNINGGEVADESILALRLCC